METSRPCGCKGIRTCLTCEAAFGIENFGPSAIDKKLGTYVYCPFCDKAYPGWNLNEYKTHPNHSGIPIEYPGVYIKLNFLSDTEESTLIHDMDSIPWDLSQSGRRKQNFGPKCNFKKNKLKMGDFNGFPVSTKFVQDKFTSEKILNEFNTIEQCSLEYDPIKGASIDPHVDDCWIWGERIVTVNMLSDSILTMTYNEKPNSYNLAQVGDYDSVVLGRPFLIEHLPNSQPIVRIPMPRRSLLVLYGAARYEWEHRVLREDITERRVCLAYREFTPPYLKEGKHFEQANDILIRAKNFF